MDNEESSVFNFIITVAIWGYSLQFCAIIAEVVLPRGFEAGVGTVITLLVSATLITIGFMKWLNKLFNGGVE